MYKWCQPPDNEENQSMSDGYIPRGQVFNVEHYLWYLKEN
jgi:hypothetical protein